MRAMLNDEGRNGSKNFNVISLSIYLDERKLWQDFQKIFFEIILKIDASHFFRKTIFAIVIFLAGTYSTIVKCCFGRIKKEKSVSNSDGKIQWQNVREIFIQLRILF